MQSMVRALPHLLDKNWQIEIWCQEADAVDARAAVSMLPRLPALGPLEAHWFWFAAWCRLQAARSRGRTWDIIHTSGPTIPGAHVISVHFHSATWLGLIQPHEWKERARWLLTFFVTIQEWVVLALTGWSVLLPVSRALAQRIEQHGGGDKKIEVLPNALDRGRFNPAVREKHRESTRKKMGAGAKDFVFLFASTGHYRRKGFWTAVQALHECRKHAAEECGLRVRFVVVGAGEQAQQKLAPELDARYPGWREWVSLQPPCDDIERWYAGADAFLFPSTYETFSLVSLEASACGLPLLLTAFDGQEMYLRDGVNGVLLPWEAELMPACIQQFLKVGRQQMVPGPVDAVDVKGYAEALDEVYQGVVEAS